LGGLFLWASIFITAYAGLLYGIAYALWAASTLPIAAEIWRIIRMGFARLEGANTITDYSEIPATD
jgi:hypothetical protein